MLAVVRAALVRALFCTDFGKHRRQRFLKFLITLCVRRRSPKGVFVLEQLGGLSVMLDVGAFLLRFYIPLLLPDNVRLCVFFVRCWKRRRAW